MPKTMPTVGCLTNTTLDCRGKKMLQERDFTLAAFFPHVIDFPADF